MRLMLVMPLAPWLLALGAVPALAFDPPLPPPLSIPPISEARREISARAGPTSAWALPRAWGGPHR